MERPGHLSRGELRRIVKEVAEEIIVALNKNYPTYYTPLLIIAAAVSRRGKSKSHYIHDVFII